MHQFPIQQTLDGESQDRKRVISNLCGEKEKVRYLITAGEMEGERTRGRQIMSDSVRSLAGEKHTKQRRKHVC